MRCIGFQCSLSDETVGILHIQHCFPTANTWLLVRIEMCNSLFASCVPVGDMRATSRKVACAHSGTKWSIPPTIPVLLQQQACCYSECLRPASSLLLLPIMPLLPPLYMPFFSWLFLGSSLCSLHTRCWASVVEVRRSSPEWLYQLLELCAAAGCGSSCSSCTGIDRT